MSVSGALVGLARRLARYRVTVVLARTVIVPADRLVARLSRGRLVTFGLKQLPSLLLTTTGRRSGEPRTVPLLYLPDGETFVVIGSNFGQQAHPAWSSNLLANPEATVMVHGTATAVRAHLAEGAERDHLLTALKTVWPAYSSYETWAGERTLRIFRLTPR
ncbi:MAG TPA: nitroreductase family deazaflavin-dependent oxidoreductase [Micromonosporaceae bacterium]